MRRCTLECGHVTRWPGYDVFRSEGITCTICGHVETAKKGGDDA